MKFSNLTEEGLITLISGVLGVIALLVMFGCSSSGTRMSCDNLLGEEKDNCLRQIQKLNDTARYQMESRGNLR